MNMKKTIFAAVLLAVSLNSFAVEKMTDKELRSNAETSTAALHTNIIIQCPDGMDALKCEQLKTQRFANEEQTQNSYKLFLNQETQNPLSNQVIKQPLLTQPMKTE
jgi:hypothetical protein